MSAVMTQENLKGLVTAAYNRQILQISYFAPAGKSDVVREIEPYSVIEIDGATMLKAYQLQPSSGWRLFNTAFIGELRETGRMFSPRRPFAISSNGELKHIAPLESRDYEQQEYEKLLRGVMMDLQVDPDEAARLAECRTRLGLTAEEVRGVHYRIFSECLASVTRDRIVTDEERQMLLELNACLRECGCGLIQ